MSDTLLYEVTVRWLSAVRHNENVWRLRAGLHIDRLERTYRTGTVRRLALETNIGRSTLYEYAAIWRFVWRWQGKSALRTFSTYPTLDYSMLRAAVQQYDDFEDRVDMVLWAIENAYTVDQLRVELAKWRGHRVPPSPLFDEEGDGEHVVSAFMRQIQNTPNWRHRRVRVIVKEVR